MFSGVARIVRKGKIKAEVQAALQEQAQRGFFDLDPFNVAASLVDSLWARIPDALDGQFGSRPNNQVVAVVALAAAVDSGQDWGRSREGLVAALLSSASVLNQPSIRFSQIDAMLLEKVQPVLNSIRDDILSSPLAQEIDRMMNPDRP